MNTDQITPITFSQTILDRLTAEALVAYALWNDAVRVFQAVYPTIEDDATRAWYVQRFWTNNSRPESFATI